MVNKRKSAPARARAKMEYLLTGKLVCGHCDALMTGVSSTSKTKRLYHYYSCSNMRAKQCDIKNISKPLLEDFVVLKARELLTDDNINNLSINLFEAMEKDKDESNIKRLKKALKENNKQKGSLLDSLKQCSIDSVRNSIFEELSKMEDYRKELDNDLRYEEANSISITKSQIKFFLKDLRNGDPNDLKYRRTLIDVFLYKVYLYKDGKIYIIFTIKGKDYRGNIP